MKPIGSILMDSIHIFIIGLLYNIGRAAEIEGQMKDGTAEYRSAVWYAIDNRVFTELLPVCP